MRIGLFVIATGKYDRYVPQLIESSFDRFLPNHKVFWNVLVDKKPPSIKRIDPPRKFEETPEVTLYSINHRGWPGATLYRYHDILKALGSSFTCFDYIFTMDVDMRFVGPVGDEILSPMTAVLHPGFYNKPRSAYTYETNPESMAYMGPKDGKAYYAGGFQGGEAETYTAAMKLRSNWIDWDAKNGIIPVWHDESVANKHLWITGGPTKTLAPSYCWPEEWPSTEAKILALKKNHAEMRS